MTPRCHHGHPGDTVQTARAVDGRASHQRCPGGRQRRVLTVGVVSEADLLLKTEAEGVTGGSWSPGSRERDSKAHAQTAGGLMSSPALSVEPGAPLAAAARLMRKGKRQAAAGGRRRTPGRHREPRGRPQGLPPFGRGYPRRRRRGSDQERHVARPGDHRGRRSTMAWCGCSGKVDRRSEVEILSRLTLGVEGVIGGGIVGDLRFRRPPREATDGAAPRRLGRGAPQIRGSDRGRCEQPGRRSALACARRAAGHDD